MKREAVSGPRPREPMPGLATITRAWEGLGEKRLREIFPELACFGIGWGEPFCFRCGWLSPSREAADYPDYWPAARAIDAAWQASRGWLERCHLQDHYYGGTTAPLNLVPLCVLCHEEQPQCKTRSAGIAFVNSVSPREGIVPWMQMATDELGRGVKRPGREKALRKMLRAQAILAVAQNQTIKELEAHIRDKEMAADPWTDSDPQPGDFDAELDRAGPGQIEIREGNPDAKLSPAEDD
jgi:hypothetical protein